MNLETLNPGQLGHRARFVRRRHGADDDPFDHDLGIDSDDG
jgi:hypothetical protein